MRNLFRLLLLSGSLLSSVASVQSNPADTAEQLALDSLASKLHVQSPYDDLKEEARQLYISVAEDHGYNIGSPMLQRRLDEAVEELAFSAMQKAVNDDPSRPKVYWLFNPPRGSVPGGRYAYDNPENLYRTVPINSSYNYIIRGKRAAGGMGDVTFSLYVDFTLGITVDVLSSQNLVINSDGSYIITINATAPTSMNRIQSTDSTVQLIIRHSISDWNSQVADALEVELVSAESLLAPMSDDDIISKARDYFEKGIPAYISFSYGALTLSEPQNVINAPPVSATRTLLTRANSFSHYTLSKSEAIVVTLNPGVASYWSLCSYTLWMITDRPGQQLESMNMDQAVANANGTYTLVLSRVDPGVNNWINVIEGGMGIFMIRFQGLAESEENSSPIQLLSQLVPLKQLKSVLPKGPKRVTSQERETQITERAKGYAQFHM